MLSMWPSGCITAYLIKNSGDDGLFPCEVAEHSHTYMYNCELQPDGFLHLHKILAASFPPEKTQIGLHFATGIGRPGMSRIHGSTLRV